MVSRDWRAAKPGERVREVHHSHTRENLPEYVKQLLTDMGRHLAGLTAELAELRKRIETLEQETEPVLQDDLPRFLQPQDEPWQPTSRDWQIRYEMAVQARNGSATALSLMKPEADVRGVTVAMLANEIIYGRVADEARVAASFAEHAKGGGT